MSNYYFDNKDGLVNKIKFNELIYLQKFIEILLVLNFSARIMSKNCEKGSRETDIILTICKINSIDFKNASWSYPKNSK